MNFEEFQSWSSITRLSDDKLVSSFFVLVLLLAARCAKLSSRLEVQFKVERWMVQMTSVSISFIVISTFYLNAQQASHALKCQF